MIAAILLLLTPFEYTYAFTEVLSDVLTEDGLVHYQRLVEHDKFPEVVRAIELFDFSTAETDAERVAFWMNAYNIHMLNMMAQRPGRKKVLDANSGAVFFDSPVRVAGQMLTLNQIEHDILRRQDSRLYSIAPSYVDPRLHVGLNCAAVSCPRLWPEAFLADRLDQQLDKAMRHFVDSENHFRIEGDQLIASTLLKWYGEDFDLKEPAGDYLLRYMSPARLDYATIRQHLEGRSSSQIEATFEYDWTVNRAR